MVDRIGFDLRRSDRAACERNRVSGLGQPDKPATIRPVGGRGRIDAGRIFAHPAAICAHQRKAAPVGPNPRDRFANGVRGVIVPRPAKEWEAPGQRQPARVVKPQTEMVALDEHGDREA